MSNTEKTPTQLKKKYKGLSIAFFGAEFISVFTPFVTIALVNYDKYFVEYDGTKMTIATFMGLALMGIATWLVAKKKFENSFITLIVGWFAVTFIFYMLGNIINDIATIMLFGGLGILGAYGCDITSKVFDNKAKKIQEAMDQAVKENTVEDYKEELKQKVKVKIKKKQTEPEEDKSSE